MDPHKIIKNLDEEIINAMLDRFFADTEVMELGRGIQLKALSDSALSTGVDFVFNKCTKPILLELEKGETYISGPDTPKSRSKPIIIENLSVKAADRGFRAFLEQKKESTIAKIAEKIKVSGEDNDDVIDNIVNESCLNGLTKMFESFSSRVLKDWCSLMGLEINSSSKKRLAKGLIYGEDTGPTSTRNYSKPESEQVKLEAGVSEEDIKKSYTVAELKKFCTESEIPVLGTKDVLVNRIYRFLQGETIAEDEGKRKPNVKPKVNLPEPSLTSSSSIEESYDDYSEGGGSSKPAKKETKQNDGEDEMDDDDSDDGPETNGDAADNADEE